MSMQTAWDLVVGRDDLSRTNQVDQPVPVAGPDEVVLRVDRVGMTANNVTYAVVGDTMNYWEFFPAEDGWGRVPLWGFADVVSSEVPGIDVGTRLYGYLPSSSHLVVRADNVNDKGFRDSSEHRAELPGVYNVYSTTTGDPAYEAAREDLQILYRPLFVTSLMLADFLVDNELFGAQTVLMSSASSKTAYGAAFCLRLEDPATKIVGLTSAGNVDFTKQLGCYDDVVSYDDIAGLPAEEAVVYADMAGSDTLRQTIHRHFDDRLAHDAAVGVTHFDERALKNAGDLPGSPPTFFFAPTQISKRRADWGPGAIEKRFGVAWREFAPVVENWVDVHESHGPEGLRDAWLEVLSGRSDPRVGHVIQL